LAKRPTAARSHSRSLPKLALWTYQEYLTKVPNSPQRTAIEKRIAELQAEIGNQ
jgi:hypothetical protein